MKLKTPTGVTKRPQWKGTWKFLKKHLKSKIIAIHNTNAQTRLATASKHADYTSREIDVE